MILKIFSTNKNDIEYLASNNKSFKFYFNKIKHFKNLLKIENINMRNRAKTLKEIVSVYKSIFYLVREREFKTISNRKRNRMLRSAYKKIHEYENELSAINTHIDYMYEINPVCYIEITNFTEEKLLLFKKRINRMNTEAKMSGSYLYLRALEAELKEVIEICKQLELNIRRIPFDQRDNLIDFFGYDY